MSPQAKVRTDEEGFMFRVHKSPSIVYFEGEDLDQRLEIRLSKTLLRKVKRLRTKYPGIYKNNSDVVRAGINALFRQKANTVETLRWI